MFKYGSHKEVAAHSSPQDWRPSIVKDGVNGRGLVPRPRPLGLLLVPLLVLPFLLPDALHLALLKPFKAKEYAPLGIEIHEVELQ